MKKMKLLIIFALLLSANAVAVFAHETFKLVSSEKKTLKEAELDNLRKNQTPGKKSKRNLSFTETEIRLVVTTGPEDDMLSYRIQGMRNPNLFIPSGATLKILFVNIDDDMPHDFRFGAAEADNFPLKPDTVETVGSSKTEKRTEDDILHAEEIVLQATEDGAYKYFCSVRGHAKGGMWGNILVNVKPDKKLKTAKRIRHVHSEDEEKSEMLTAAKHSDDEDEDSGDEESDSMAGMKMSKLKMPSVSDINSPMTRESSGTSWNPDSSPMYARMKMYEDGGMAMFMGGAVMRYTNIGSKRNVSAAGKGSRQRLDAPSMFMAMYSKPFSNKSQIGFRAMISLDPIIERGYGYPLLYQSGETFHGLPIHDRQHPHDFFSELSVSYSYKISRKHSFYFYAGYPGEPALGPPTFMHRISAMNNPDAPISHHWQDSTHITWGVLTAGYSFGKFKFEASAFKGAEPDENRWNFDTPKLDSLSGRVSINPTKNLAFQISYGYLKNPELEVRIRRRTTTSAIYNKKISDDKNWSSSFVWGQNYENNERTNAFLFESNYDFGKNAIFGRFERVQKSGHELVFNASDENKIFNVSAYSLGYIRDLVRDKGTDVGLGGMLTFNQNPSSLNSYYGGTTHKGWQLFLRLRPSSIKH